jgi:site-specific DNA-methyltransferase (adenine-specific)
MSQGFYTSPQAFSSATDEWSTPIDFYNKLAKEFNFVLDVAALSTSCRTTSWYGPDHTDHGRRDGLAQDWAAEAATLGGDVWMNPPYGRTIGDWMSKADQECANGATIVCLVPARTDTRWFHEYCAHHELRFIRGRLKFGTATNSAPFPSLVVVMRGAQ